MQQHFGLWQFALFVFFVIFLQCSHVKTRIILGVSLFTYTANWFSFSCLNYNCDFQKRIYLPWAIHILCSDTTWKNTSPNIREVSKNKHQTVWVTTVSFPPRLLKKAVLSYRRFLLVWPPLDKGLMYSWALWAYFLQLSFWAIQHLCKQPCKRNVFAVLEDESKMQSNPISEMWHKG